MLTLNRRKTKFVSGQGVWDDHKGLHVLAEKLPALSCLEVLQSSETVAEANLPGK